MTLLQVYSANLPITSDLYENLFNILETINQCKLDADPSENVVVCFAECSLTGYDVAGVESALANDKLVPLALNIIAASCRQLSIAIVVGTAMRAKDEVVENVAVAINQRGEFVNVQSKMEVRR